MFSRECCALEKLKLLSQREKDEKWNESLQLCIRYLESLKSQSLRILQCKNETVYYKINVEIQQTSVLNNHSLWIKNINIKFKNT